MVHFEDVNKKTLATTRWKILFLLVITAILLLSMTVYWFHESILLAIGDFLIIQDDLQPADVIHVISGPDQRADYGIYLMKQGLGKMIFFTGGWCPTIQGIHADRGEDRAINQGVLPQEIYTDSFQVTSTYEEAVRLKEFIEKSQVPVKSLIIVSDPYHMRRSRWTYKRVLGEEIDLEMAPVPFEYLPYSRDWWKHSESRNFVRQEYLKLLYYYARYKYSWGPITHWLASLDKN
jgi:uncharacterized SAM-binding protein YcdF (DUF218 family)